MNETHLSTEERLLLADGELAAERAAHVDACPQCAAAVEAFDATLATATAALRSEVGPEPVEAPARSWARLAATLDSDAARVAAADCHLTDDELLLQIDDELAPSRSRHLESCAGCHVSLLETQAFLFDIEHELRALIPAEPVERRRRSALALDRQLYPRKKEVVSFPVRWGVVYAAAAAMTFAVFAGLWRSETRVEAPELAFAAPPAPAVTAPEAVVPTTPAAASTEPPAASASTPPEAASPEPAPAPPERYVFAGRPASDAPRPGPLAAEPLAGLATEWDVAALEFPAPPVAPPPSTPREAAPAAREPTSEQRLAAIEGRWLAVRAGFWDAAVTAEREAGRLVFRGALAHAAQRERFETAVRQAAGDRPVAFDLTVQPRPQVPVADAGVSEKVDWVDRPVGGLARTALVEHYRDAARRSFRSPTPSLLESEIARFTNDVFRSQSALLEHGYALDRLLADAAPVVDAADEATLERLRKTVDFHLDAIERHESVIYARLSEVLPRKYWSHRAERPADSASAAAGADLLDAALALEENLAALLSGSTSTLDVGEADASPGAALARVRSDVRRLRAWSRDVQ